jgi:hypothetical protein
LTLGIITIVFLAWNVWGIIKHRREEKARVS